MARYEYMRLLIELIPKEILAAYGLQAMVHKDHVYMEIRRNMHGLPQARILAKQLLTTRLFRHTHGLLRRKRFYWVQIPSQPKIIQGLLVTSSH
jgi:hypothetical protein